MFCRTDRTISGLQLVQNRYVNQQRIEHHNFGLIEETVDMSHIILAESTRKVSKLTQMPGDKQKKSTETGQLEQFETHTVSKYAFVNKFLQFFQDSWHFGLQTY